MTFGFDEGPLRGQSPELIAMYRRIMIVYYSLMPFVILAIGLSSFHVYLHFVRFQRTFKHPTRATRIDLACIGYSLSLVALSSISFYPWLDRYTAFLPPSPTTINIPVKVLSDLWYIVYDIAIIALIQLALVRYAFVQTMSSAIGKPSSSCSGGARPAAEPPAIPNAPWAIAVASSATPLPCAAIGSSAAAPLGSPVPTLMEGGAQEGYTVVGALGGPVDGGPVENGPVDGTTNGQVEGVLPDDHHDMSSAGLNQHRRPGVGDRGWTPQGWPYWMRHVAPVLASICLQGPLIRAARWFMAHAMPGRLSNTGIGGGWLARRGALAPYMPTYTTVITVASFMPLSCFLCTESYAIHLLSHGRMAPTGIRTYLNNALQIGFSGGFIIAELAMVHHFNRTALAAAGEVVTLRDRGLQLARNARKHHSQGRRWMLTGEARRGSHVDSPHATLTRAMRGLSMASTMGDTTATESRRPSSAFVKLTARMRRSISSSVHADGRRPSLLPTEAFGAGPSTALGPMALATMALSPVPAPTPMTAAATWNGMVRAHPTRRNTLIANALPDTGPHFSHSLAALVRVTAPAFVPAPAPVSGAALGVAPALTLAPRTASRASMESQTTQSSALQRSNERSAASDGPAGGFESTEAAGHGASPCPPLHSASSAEVRSNGSKLWADARGSGGAVGFPGSHGFIRGIEEEDGVSEECVILSVAASPPRQDPGIMTLDSGAPTPRHVSFNPTATAAPTLLPTPGNASTPTAAGVVPPSSSTRWTPGGPLAGNVGSGSSGGTTSGAAVTGSGNGHGSGSGRVPCPSHRPLHAAPGSPPLPLPPPASSPSLPPPPLPLVHAAAATSLARAPTTTIAMRPVVIPDLALCTPALVPAPQHVPRATAEVMDGDGGLGVGPDVDLAPAAAVGGGRAVDGPYTLGGRNAEQMYQRLLRVLIRAERRLFTFDVCGGALLMLTHFYPWHGLGIPWVVQHAGSVCFLLLLLTHVWLVQRTFSLFAQHASVAVVEVMVVDLALSTAHERSMMEGGSTAASRSACARAPPQAGRAATAAGGRHATATQRLAYASTAAAWPSRTTWRQNVEVLGESRPGTWV
ncbi:hypothetical protein CXG81DRAFT_18396 [Caulochytrium protostelioides]|uniref:Uncharacterized protein n=1 Tax=Caulochytrium protostelioides TaxID=1555241 RepID=A0A4P9X989_9FUNG|nr:hypothetical protein CXG81DRAFT_18396 [Caulochytrium protostelioides]|eukprot:RKP01897.1 hypothetical protein CXG81DRAFT_18396 [Caulochytrium protostelioides]